MDQPTTQLSHRSRNLVILVCFVGVVFILRLFYLQVVQHSYYESEALKEHVSKFTITAKRGLIYAHDGTTKFVPLVLNEPVFTAYADPRYVKEPDKVANTLKRIAGGNLVAKFEDGLRAIDRQYVVLAKDLSKQQSELIKSENLSGIGLQETEKRVYTEGQLASQLLGFVNNDGNGQYGLEEGINSTLAGVDGQLKTVTDVHGIPISIGPQSVQLSPKDGKNVVLTIDRTIQHKVETALKAGLDHAKATKGSVIVVNPNNGHVLAMANLPTYDPNNFGQNADFSLFQNRSVSDPYEPGSVIKSLTMAVGLNEGVIEPNTTYNNTGSVHIADTTIKNVLQYPRGSITMTQVLQYSFNTGAVFVVQQLGGGDINRVAKQKLYEYFDGHYFFGHQTGIELAGEITGRVIAPDDPDGGPVRYANMAFGQGVTMSMTQVTAAFSAVINGGVYYSPQVIDGYLEANNYLAAKPSTIRKSDVIKPDASAKLRAMLHDARVSSSISRGDKPGYVIGGKTGTAQVYDPVTGRYSDTATIGSYLGFGGQDKPQYVIMVRVDDSNIGGYSGSAAAAPIFTDISNWMLDYLQIQPRG